MNRTWSDDAVPCIVMLEIRHVALAVLVIVTANPPAAKLMVVTSLPCPLTVIFLFDQEIFPDEQLPGPMLTVSPSTDLLTAFCRAIVIEIGRASCRERGWVSVGDV